MSKYPLSSNGFSLFSFRAHFLSPLIKFASVLLYISKLHQAHILYVSLIGLKALFTQATYGDQFSFDLLVKSTRPNSLSILDCLIMLLVDGFLYFLLTIYFDNVIQGEYGTAKPFWFCLSPAYWMDRNVKKSSKYESSSDNADHLELENNADYEQVPVELNSKIALRLALTFAVTEIKEN